MLSETLAKGLSDYAIGEKLHALRLRKKIGLVELGRHTGLSAAMLSKVERGKLFPTLPTLLRIALVFGVGLEYFLRMTRSATRRQSCADPNGSVSQRELTDAISPFTLSSRRSRVPAGPAGKARATPRNARSCSRIGRLDLFLILRWPFPTEESAGSHVAQLSSPFLKVVSKDSHSDGL